MGAVTGSSVRMRTEASTSSSIITNLEKNTAVAVLGDAQDGWYPIAFNGQSGYIFADYLILDQDGLFTAPGRIIYGVGCGALTVLIRVFGGFPEGVSFAILIMNCCAWMFDKHTQRRQFGVSREDVKAKKAAAKAAKKEAKEAAANG